MLPMQGPRFDPCQGMRFHVPQQRTRMPLTSGNRNELRSCLRAVFLGPVELQSCAACIWESGLWGQIFSPKPEARSSTGHCSEELSHSHAVWTGGPLVSPVPRVGKQETKMGRYPPPLRSFHPGLLSSTQLNSLPGSYPFNAGSLTPTSRDNQTPPGISWSAGSLPHPNCLCLLGAPHPAVPHPVLEEGALGWVLGGGPGAHMDYSTRVGAVHVCACPQVNTDICKQPLQIPWNGTLESQD